MKSTEAHVIPAISADGQQVGTGPKVLCLGSAMRDTLGVKLTLRAIELGVGLGGGTVVGRHGLTSGGRGYLDAMIMELGGSIRRVLTRDPLNRLHIAEYAFNAYRSLAIIEASKVIGEDTVKPEDRKPLLSSSRGLADLIMHAVGYGAKHVFIGLGNVISCDGGIGMLRRFESALLDDGQGHEALGPRDFRNPPYIDLNMIRQRLKGVRLTVFCDVKLPVLGDHGYVQSFVQAQGASANEVSRLEAEMPRWIDVIEAKAGRKLRDLPGAGAGGGLGMAFAALGATLDRGADRFCRLINLEERLQACDGLLTCEGQFDQNSFRGKAPWVASQYAVASGKRGIILCGIADPEALSRARHEGVDVIEIGRGLPPQRRGPETFIRIEQTVSSVMRRFG